MEYGNERRRETRLAAGVSAYMVVISGKNESIRSPREKVQVKDISPSGASLISPTVRPGGIHVMYNDLMLYKNHIELQILRGEEEVLTVIGRVVWYDRPDGMIDYLLGIEFDSKISIEGIIEG